MSEYGCDVKNGFHLKRQDRATVGFVYALSFKASSPVKLATDLSLLSPEDPNKKDSVVAVIEDVSWDRNALGALELKARFTEDNIGLLSDTLTNFGDSQPIIQLGFAVWKFHNKENTYYPMIGTDSKGRKEVTAKLASEPIPGTELPYEISRIEDPYITNPANFVATIRIEPHPASSNEVIILASDTSKKRPQQWGVAVAAGG